MRGLLKCPKKAFLVFSCNRRPAPRVGGLSGAETSPRDGLPAAGLESRPFLGNLPPRPRQSPGRELPGVRAFSDRPLQLGPVSHPILPPTLRQSQFCQGMPSLQAVCAAVRMTLVGLHSFSRAVLLQMCGLRTGRRNVTLPSVLPADSTAGMMPSLPPPIGRLFGRATPGAGLIRIDTLGR